MKGLLIFVLLFPLQLIAQDPEGVWVGILHNDSTELDLHYEIVISEQKGKLTGFSYTNFIVDGRSYTGVKSLIVNKRFGKLYIEDDKLVHHNYEFEPPKGVRQASILEMSSAEEMLAGRFTTTKTKQYGKPVTGHIYLLKKQDRSVSKLMEILHGLDFASNLSFIEKEQPVAVVAATKEPVAITSKSKENLANDKATITEEEKKPVVKKDPVIAAPTTRETLPVSEPGVKEKPKTEVPLKVTPPVTTETPLVKTKETNTEKETAASKNKETAPVTVPVVKETTNAKTRETPVVSEPVAIESNTVKIKETSSSTPGVKETSTAVVPAVKETVKPTIQQQLATRKIEPVQTIWFTSDSLLLELYDNGYVDGDSVSIVVNGKAFISNLRLSEKAARKTIHITPEMGDSVNLVMLAENLGTIYPNSGLAIIKDGKKEHRVAFSGDLQKNASIILRRKRE